MRSLLADFRYALRGLRKNPVLTAVAVLSLGIGIGGNTAIFSLVDRVLLRSLPVRDPKALVLLQAPGGWSGSVETNYGDTVSFSWPKYRRLQEQSSDAFEGFFARFPFGASIAARSQTDAGQGELVSGNYFDLLGIRPALGRLIAEDDVKTRGANPVAVLSHGYWNRRFGGDPGVLNQSLIVNGAPLTIVGVAPAGFRSVGAGEAPDVFAPITMAAELTPTWGAAALDNSHAYWLNVFGRLRPGVSREQATASTAVIWPRVLAADAADLPAGAGRDRYLAKRLTLLPAGNGISSIRSDVQAPLYLLMGMVGLVLLIACANIANLLLARAVARGKEVAIRLSLGASRGRLIRHMLAESLLLSIAGGAVGLIVAAWAGHLMLGVIPEGLPTAGLSADLDLRVLSFAFGLALVTGLLFGMVPALRATRPDLTPILKQGSSAAAGPARLRQVLVVGQIALSALLLAAAGLFANSLNNLRSLDPGFRAAGLDSFSINPTLLGYKPDRALRLFSDLERDLRSTAGISGVSRATYALMTGSIDIRAFVVEGYQPQPNESMTLHNNRVGPDFFSVLGIPLLAGREFRENDKLGAPPVAIVNESFARKYFPGSSPVGRHLTLRRAGAVMEIVGVVKDAKYDDLREQARPYVYMAAAQDPAPGPMTYYVRASISGESVASVVRSATRRLDSSLPVQGPNPVGKQILSSVFTDRMVAMLASTFALLATALAAIGLYGVVAWAVSRRTREIGIRMALGAEPGSILKMVLADVVRLGIAGLVLAAPLWFVAARLLKTLLFGVTEHDPVTLALALGLVLAVALAAGSYPAWRASRIDPNSAIRVE